MSSNGSTPGSALLFCTVPDGDANTTVTDGRLLVYDPDNWVTNPDGSQTSPVLWDSQRWNIQYAFNKFNPPIVDGGQIYVPNYNVGVDVYELAPQSRLGGIAPLSISASAIQLLFRIRDRRENVPRSPLTKFVFMGLKRKAHL